MRAILAGLAVLVGLPGAAAAVHLAVLAVASLFYRQPQPRQVPEVAFLVVVPAQDEEAVIADTLRSLTADRRPQDRILVVADRCTDRTAEIARGFGVDVLERGEGASPGRAAALRDGLRHAQDWGWDVYISVDADSEVEPGFFDALEQTFAVSDGAVQARSEARPGRGPVAASSLLSFAAQGVMVPRGRDRLGLSVRLRGSGMALRRDLVESMTYRTEGASEDLWFSLDLCLAGILPRHADRARLRSESADSVAAAGVQRARWESGRLLAAREFLRPLLRHRTAASLEAAVHLATPPVAVAAFSLLVALGLAWASALSWLIVGVSALTLLLGFAVFVALVEARVPLRAWLSLLLAPVYILWKVWIQLRAARGLGKAHEPYARTPRR